MSRRNFRIPQQEGADFLFCPWAQNTPATPLGPSLKNISSTVLQYMFRMSLRCAPHCKTSYKLSSNLIDESFPFLNRLHFPNVFWLLADMNDKLINFQNKLNNKH